jgi:hypothetical protein
MRQLEDRLKTVEIKQEVLYSKQEMFDRRLEATEKVIDSVISLKRTLWGCCIVIPLCATITCWSINRVIAINDDTDKQQTQILLEHTHAVEAFSRDINDLRTIIKKHFKD